MTEQTLPLSTSRAITIRGFRQRQLLGLCIALSTSGTTAIPRPGRRHRYGGRQSSHRLHVRTLPTATPSMVDARGALSEMRHDLFGEHLHVVDPTVEIASFRAEPKP